MAEEWRDLEKDLKLCEQMPGDDARADAQWAASVL